MSGELAQWSRENSPGTADAIRQAKAAGLTVHVYPKEN